MKFARIKTYFEGHRVVNGRWVRDENQDPPEDQGRGSRRTAPARPTRTAARNEKVEDLGDGWRRITRYHPVGASNRTNVDAEPAFAAPAYAHD